MNRPRHLLLILCAALSAAVPAASGQAQENDPVASGAEALRNTGSYPWYDAEQDAVRRIELKPTPPPAAPQDWDPPSLNSRNWGTWPNFWNLLQYLAWIVMIALLVLLIVLLVRAFLRREASRLILPDEVTLEMDDTVDRIEHLPVPLRRGQSDLLGEARRQYELGNYNEAIIYLYSYELVELDKHQLLRLARGKTNRQYLREVRAQAPLAQVLGQTMTAFEDAFFGAKVLDRERFEQCWNRLDSFHAQLDLVPV